MYTFPKLSKVEIDSVDVSSYVYTGRILRTKQPVKFGTFKLRKDVSLVLDVSKGLIGKSVVVQRGFLSATERVVLRGEISNCKLAGSVYEISCGDKLYAGVRREYDYSFDQNVDVEAGRGSEIVKTLFNFLNISCDDDSVPSTGTDANFLLFTYPAKGAAIESLKDLGKVYNRRVFYKDSEDKGYFTPFDYEESDVVLQLGVNVVNRVQWLDTDQGMVNNLTLIGGQQLDWTREVFNGGSTIYTLLAKPVDTYIYVNSVLMRRGVNSSDPKDYYVDIDQKKIVFTTTTAGGSGSVIIEYSYNVPVKVNNSSDPSIDAYLQRDLTLSNERLLNTDDASLNAINILDQVENPLTSAPLKVIGNNSLEVNQTVRVVDVQNNRDEFLAVESISMFFPFKPDEVVVGKVPMRDLDIDLQVYESIRRLQRQLGSDVDVEVTLKNNAVNEEVSGYNKVEVADATSGVLYWSRDSWYDASFVWGDVEVVETYSLYSLIPINRTLMEDFRSEEFKDVSTSADWTDVGVCVFADSEVAVSKVFYKDLNVSTVFLTADFDGDLAFEITNNGVDWQSLALNGYTTLVTTGGELQWRATSVDASTLRKVKIVIG